MNEQLQPPHHPDDPQADLEREDEAYEIWRQNRDDEELYAADLLKQQQQESSK